MGVKSEVVAAMAEYSANRAPFPESLQKRFLHWLVLRPLV